MWGVCKVICWLCKMWDEGYAEEPSTRDDDEGKDERETK